MTTSVEESEDDTSSEDDEEAALQNLKPQRKQRPFRMVQIGDNLISNPQHVDDLPEEVKEILKKRNVKKVLRGMANEEGNVVIEGKDKRYQITYVQIIPAKTDCFEKYQQMQREKLHQVFNIPIQQLIW